MPGSGREPVCCPERKNQRAREELLVPPPADAETFKHGSEKHQDTGKVPRAPSPCSRGWLTVLENAGDHPDHLEPLPASVIAALGRSLQPEEQQRKESGKKERRL